MRTIMRTNSDEHPVIAESKRVILAIMRGGLSFKDASYAMRLNPEVMYELRRRDKAFYEEVSAITGRNERVTSIHPAEMIRTASPGSDVALPVDEPVYVRDVIGLDPDLSTDIAGSPKRLFLRHYASSLKRVESLDLAGISASDFIRSITPGTDDYDAEFHNEIMEIELRFTLSLEDRHRANAISSGKDASVKMAMRGLNNAVSAKYEPKKAPVSIDRSKKTVNVTIEGGHNVRDALLALSDAAQGPRRLKEVESA